MTDFSKKKNYLFIILVYWYVCDIGNLSIQIIHQFLQSLRILKTQCLEVFDISNFFLFSRFDI
jgi:hypothetical protein